MVDVEGLSTGTSRNWKGFLRDWHRSLKAGNYPETTRYNYLLAVTQLARFLAEYSRQLHAEAAAEDPTEVTKDCVESFQAWMIETRSASTALNKHKGLQQFFRWLVEDEEEIDRSPIERIKQPKRPTTLVPVIATEDTKKLLAACKGKGFMNLRDEAIIRLFCNTGARLSEVASLTVGDIDFFHRFRALPRQRQQGTACAVRRENSTCA